MNKLGIIGAMEEEVNRLKEKMEKVEVRRLASIDFYEGSIAGKRLVIARSGIGKVNAAVCSQILVDIFDVKLLIQELQDLLEILILRILYYLVMLFSMMWMQGDLDMKGVIPRMKPLIYS